MRQFCFCLFIFSLISSALFSQNKKDRDFRLYGAVSFNLFHLRSINDSLSSIGAPKIKNTNSTLGFGFGYRGNKFGFGFEGLLDLISSRLTEAGETRSATTQYHLYSNYYFHSGKYNRWFTSLGLGLIDKELLYIRKAEIATFSGLVAKPNAIALSAIAPVASISFGFETGVDQAPIKSVIKIGYAFAPAVEWQNQVDYFSNIPWDNLGYAYIQLNSAFLGYWNK